MSLTTKSAPTVRNETCMDELLQEIHFLRKHLYELGREVNQLTHPQLVEVSQLLDKKLNFYHSMSNGRLHLPSNSGS